MPASSATAVPGPPQRRRGTRQGKSVPARYRLALVAALVVLSLTTTYATLMVFARVYPALFPGQTLAGTIGVVRVVAPLPGLKPVDTLNEGSSFNDRINLLVIGLDRRPYDPEVGGYLTDVIMVASLDPVAKRTSVLSFPRDLLVDIHVGDGLYDSYEDRINSSYHVGFEATGRVDGGAKQLQRDLYENFGVETDQWVILDFLGVESLIDAVGGVDLDIPYELSVPDWWYSNDDYNPVWVSFPPGVQHLDGYHAVAFGRYRNDSDLYRVKRQQLVLEAAIAKLFSLGLLNNPIDLWDAYSATVKTDISKARMLGLVPLFRQTQGRTSMYSAGDPVNDVETVTGYTTAGGAAVLLWDPDNVRYWLDQAFPKVKYVGTSVEIADGFGSDSGARAAALARYLLYYQNLPTVYMGPSVASQPTTFVTLYGDREELASDVLGWLHLPPTALRREERIPGGTQPDVVITIGQDFTIPGD